MRTILQFQTNQDIWPIVEKWATDKNFKIVLSNNDERCYKSKNHVFLK